MELTQPCVDLEQSFKSYIRELADEERYPYPLDLDHSNFESYITTLAQYSKGVELPSHLVPNTTFWLVDNSQILGCSHLRHHLNPALKRAGGHIGLGIRPSARAKGLSKTLLTLTLQKAFEIGIDDVHIHCYADNIASKAMIMSCGAVFDSEVCGEQSLDKRVLRFIHNRNSQLL